MGKAKTQPMGKGKDHVKSTASSFEIGIHSLAPELLDKYPSVAYILQYPNGKGIHAEIKTPNEEEIQIISILDEIQLRNLLTLMMELRSLEFYDLSDIIREHFLKIGKVSIEKIELEDQIVENVTLSNYKLLRHGRIFCNKNIIVQKRISPCPEKYTLQASKWTIDGKGIPRYIVQEDVLKKLIGDEK